MDSDIQSPPYPREVRALKTRISWTRIVLVLLVAILSGIIFGTIGYFWGVSNSQSESLLARTQSFNAIKPSFTPTPIYVPSKNTIANIPVLSLSPTPLQYVISPKLNPIPGWKVYTSATEKISFRYPESWSIASSPKWAQFNNSDQISLQSPDRQVTVTWDSFISGLGGGCDDTLPLGQNGACSLFTLIEKKAIAGAKGLFVISGTITTDGTKFQPFLAVQDDSIGALTSSRKTMGYDEYAGRNNEDGSVIFSTAGTYAGGPKLSQADANAWFTKPSAQQAKQILESLTY